MNFLFPSMDEKMAYYKLQAEKLRAQAREVREKLEDFIEAQRLDDLATKAEEEVRSLQQQIQTLASG